jgi:hypothetical protein
MVPTLASTWQGDQPDEQPVDDMVRRVLLSMLEERYTRRPTHRCSGHSGRI